MTGVLGWLPATEYQARVDRLVERLRADGIDALVVTGEANIAYLFGLHVPSFASPTRPIIGLCSAAGDAVLHTSRSQAPNARAWSWVSNLRAFDTFEDSAVELVADSLRGLGLERGTVGAELGGESRLGLTITGFERLRANLPGATFVDGTPAIWALRQRKSSAELGLLRRAGQITAGAFDQALSLAAPGVSEVELYQRFVISLVEQGAQPGYLALHSGPGHYRRVSSHPTARRLAPGDLLWMDGGGTYRGYWSDVTRLVAIGEPTPDHRAAYRTAVAATRAAASAAVPGRPITDLVAAADEVLRAAGAERGPAGRIGHGLGLQLTEPPSLAPANHQPVMVGMALAIEPAIARWDGYLTAEENVVITAQGAQPLAPPAPSELLSHEAY